jgi:hypothetical protein
MHMVFRRHGTVVADDVVLIGTECDWRGVPVTGKFFVIFVGFIEHFTVEMVSPGRPMMRFSNMMPGVSKWLMALSV